MEREMTLIENFTKAEDQLLRIIYVFERRPPVDPETGEVLSATFKNLRSRGEEIFGEQLEDWTKARETLVKKELLEYKTSVYSFTEKGKQIFLQLRRKRLDEGFSTYLLQAATSKAYSLFCERIYGKDLCQYNMMTMPQLEKMLTVLNLSEKNSQNLSCMFLA